MVAVRRLFPSDAEASREIRLEGLDRCPECFAASHDEEAAQDDAFFQDWLARHAVFGGERDGALLGIVTFRAQPIAKMNHKGHLSAMYVRDAARGSGLARDLVEAALAHARDRFEAVNLTVVTENRRAVRFYEKCGFATYGVERRALRVGDRFFDEALMSRAVD